MSAQWMKRCVYVAGCQLWPLNRKESLCAAGVFLLAGWQTLPLSQLLLRSATATQLSLGNVTSSDLSDAGSHRPLYSAGSQSLSAFLSLGRSSSGPHVESSAVGTNCIFLASGWQQVFTHFALRQMEKIPHTCVLFLQVRVTNGVVSSRQRRSYVTQAWKAPFVFIPAIFFTRRLLTLKRLSQTFFSGNPSACLLVGWVCSNWNQVLLMDFLKKWHHKMPTN